MIFDDNIFAPAGGRYKQSPFLKVFVYGESGAGKTSWASRAPKPLILSLEEQGMASIARANPDAIAIPCHDLSVFEKVWGAVLSGEPAEIDGQPALKVTIGKQSAIVQTIVIDSITELTQKYHDRQRGAQRNMSIDQWGIIKNQGNKSLREATSIKANVIVLARAHTSTEDGKSISIPITTPKSLADDLGGHFNIVARAGRKAGKSGIGHYLRMSGSDGVAGKKYGHTLPDAVWVTDQPGRTTLGSISLHAIGDYAPHEEGDDAAWVTAGPPSAEEVGTDGLGGFEENEESEEDLLV